jgi:DNA-binding response OmpR family regulator
MLLAHTLTFMKNEIRKILIIDDDPDICEVTKLILTNAGYQTIAMDHYEPFSEKDAPDAILLDISLGGQDGRKICRQLKNNKATSHIPIIIFSANPATEKAAREAGADDSIEKPYQLNDLVQKVRNLHKIPHHGEKVSQGV